MNDGNKSFEKAFNDICKRHRKKRRPAAKMKAYQNRARLLILIQASLQKERQN